MNNGRSSGADDRRRAPAGMWTCIKCRNMVRRGTTKCGCGNVPPAHVSAVREPTQRSSEGKDALIRQLLQALGANDGQSQAGGRQQRARPRAPWAREAAPAPGGATTTPESNGQQRANGQEHAAPQANPAVRAANTRLEQLRSQEKDIARSMQGCAPLAKAVLQEKLDEVRGQIKGTLAARTEHLPGARQVRIALNHLQNEEDKAQRAERKLTAHKEQIERLQRELVDLEAKQEAARAGVLAAKESLAKAEAVVADERASTADVAMDHDFTMGDEGTRCGPHVEAEAISIQTVKDLAEGSLRQLRASGSECDTQFVDFLIGTFAAHARLMRVMPDEGDETPATQVDPTQASQVDPPLAQPVPGLDI